MLVMKETLTAMKQLFDGKKKCFQYYKFRKMAHGNSDALRGNLTRVLIHSMLDLCSLGIILGKKGCRESIVSLSVTIAGSVHNP